jgi:hypothetical protein
MTHTDSTPGDFYREDKPATNEDVVVRAATDYSRMAVSVEEHEQMMLRIYGPDRLPGTAARARSQEGRRSREPDPHGACAVCGEPLTWGLRYCSQKCFHKSRLHKPPTHAELIEEMQVALDRLREEVGDE